MWVESDLSALVRATDAYEDSLRKLGQVEISVEKDTQQLMLTGQSYQVSEICFISNAISVMQRIAGFRSAV